VADVIGSGSGRPLDGQTRAWFEPRLGHDLGGVRVHTGAQADASAKAIDALAYTVGRDVVFAANRYSPGTHEGRRLLAHELTHVKQQSGLPSSPAAKLAISAPGDAGEREADAAADRMVGGESAGAVPTLGFPLLQRACASGATTCPPSGVPGSAKAFNAPTTKKITQMGKATFSSADAVVEFMKKEAPGVLPNSQPVFVDSNLGPSTAAAYNEQCTNIEALGRCIFVASILESDANRFNTDPTATSFGTPQKPKNREDFRVYLIQTVTHELQHGTYETGLGKTGNPTAGGKCPRTAISDDLSELSAIISEFPAVFRSVPANKLGFFDPSFPGSGTSSSDPDVARLDKWFNSNITSTDEGIRGILKQIECTCDCSEGDAYVKEVYYSVAMGWGTAMERLFNKVLSDKKWGMRWPIAPPP
jgi:hypothetical protein